MNIRGLAGRREAWWDVGMSWQEWIDELAEADEELPWPGEEVTQQWAKLGRALPEMLWEAEYQLEDAVTAAIEERLGGVSWDEGLSPLTVWLVKQRLEWALGVMETMRSCGVPDGTNPEFLRVLLHKGWEDGGFSQTHDSCQRTLLSDALLGIEPPASAG